MGNRQWNRTASGPDAPADSHVKFASRQDCVLATIIMQLNLSSLQLFGNPEDCIEVWKKLNRSDLKENLGINR